MPFWFAAVKNKEISQLIRQAVPEIHEEGNEVRASGARKFDHVIPTLKQLHWLPVAQDGEFYYLVP